MKQVCPAVIFGIPLAFLEQSGDSILPASSVNIKPNLSSGMFFFAKRVSRYVLSYYNKLLFLFADSKLKHTNNCMHMCILETSESIINKIVID